MTLPTVMTLAGLQPQAPADIRAQLLAAVAAASPGYTANLPGTLIEDISSTDVASIVLMESFRVELLNSISPYTANAFLLNQLGQIYGVQKAAATVTSVSVVFSGPLGYVIPPGFVVGDGVYQYAVQDGAIVGAGNVSLPATCFATVSGSWVVLPGTVTSLISSVPTGIALTVTNPLAGTPAVAAEDETNFRARVLQAGLAGCQGMPSFLKTMVNNVPGVQSRLISVIQQIQGEGGWEVLVGGGDIYQVALAIFRGILDVSILQGSIMSISNITNANPGVVTTVLNHGYVTGQAVMAHDVLGMTQINNLPLTATVIDQKNFSVGVDTSGFSTYQGAGYMTPNGRNNTVGIIDYPDTYTIAFVTPPQQSVAIAVTYNTTITNFVNGAAVQQLGNPALVAYVNSIVVGQPMNLFALQTTFQEAIASVIPEALLTRMIFAVSINGVGVSPSVGTGIIAGDPESYFLTTPALVTINQG